MKNLRIKSAAALLPVLIAYANHGIAAPFSTFDARTMAMGDVGVASAAPGSAALFNPALLSTYAYEKDFSLVLPNFGFNAFIDSDALDGLEAIDDNDYDTQLTDTTDAFNQAITDLTAPIATSDPLTEAQGRLDNLNTTKENFTNTVRDFETQIRRIDEAPIGGNAGLYFAVAVPSKNLGVSVYASGGGSVELAANIGDCDFDLLDTYVTTLENFNPDLNTIANDPSTIQLQDASTSAACGSVPVILNGDLVEPDSNLQSTVSIAAIATSEIGVALSKAFKIGGKDVAFGITPKLVSVTTRYVEPEFNDFDDDNYEISDDLENNEQEYDDFNFDLGVSTTFLNGDLTTGLVIKNLIGNDYAMVYTPASGPALVKTVSLDPQVRAGVALKKWGFTLAADVDLIENDGIFEGNESQYMGLGAEYNLFNVMQLRAGMRSNLSNSEDTAFTAGVGFNIVAVHFDLAAQVGENNAGIGFQFGMEF